MQRKAGEGSVEEYRVIGSNRRDEMKGDEREWKITHHTEVDNKIQRTQPINSDRSHTTS